MQMKNLTFFILFSVFAISPISAVQSSNDFGYEIMTDCNLKCPVCGETKEINHVHTDEGIYAHCNNCSYSGYNFEILND